MSVTPQNEPPRRVEITISWRTLAVIGGALLLAWAFVTARDAILLVFIALFMALVLDTPTTWMTEHWHLKRGNAATILVLGLVIFLTALAVLLITPFVGAVRDLIEDLPNIVQRIRDSELFQRLDEKTDIGEELQTRAESLAGSLPGQLGDVFALGGKVFGAGLTLFTLTFMTLFLLVDLPHLSAAVRSVLFPATATRVEQMERDITATIGRYAIGAVTIAAIAGTVQGTTAWLLGRAVRAGARDHRGPARLDPADRRHDRRGHPLTRRPHRRRPAGGHHAHRLPASTSRSRTSSCSRRSRGERPISRGSSSLRASSSVPRSSAWSARSSRCR